MANDFRNEISSKNEGEGSKSAARAYNKDQQAFVKSGKVDDAAKQAKQALSGAEKESLQEAEAKGKAHSHGEDSQLTKKTKH